LDDRVELGQRVWGSALEFGDTQSFLFQEGGALNRPCLAVSDALDRRRDAREARDEGRKHWAGRKEKAAGGGMGVGLEEFAAPLADVENALGCRKRGLPRRSEQSATGWAGGAAVVSAGDLRRDGDEGDDTR